MAALNKKLHVVKNGNDQAITLYTTNGEAGVGTYSFKVIVDGVTAYVPLNGGTKTPLKWVLGSNTYTATTDGTPSGSVTFNGSGTFTVPSGITKIRCTNDYMNVVVSVTAGVTYRIASSEEATPWEDDLASIDVSRSNSQYAYFVHTVGSNGSDDEYSEWLDVTVSYGASINNTATSYSADSGKNMYWV